MVKFATLLGMVLVTRVALAAASAVSAAAERGSARLWDMSRLSKPPKTRAWQAPFKGEATPIMIEGEPYQGRPTWCFAFYGVPEWATPERKAPAIVLVHGGLGTAYPEWVRMWVKRGYAAICVDTCGALPIQTADGKWLANPEGGPRGWGRVDRTEDPLREQWVYHAIAAVVRSHSFIRSLPNVDTRKVGVTGVSWGGFLTCILAAVDDRFAYAVPVYGCGFNFERGGLVWSGPLAKKWGRLWDPCVYLPEAKCPMLWVDGTNDFAFSLDRVRRSAALASRVEHAFATRLRMPHGHGAAGEGPREILAFADHFARGGADIVRVGECRRDGSRIEVPFMANGRKIARAELMWTTDGSGVKWSKRNWSSRVVPDFDPTSGVVSVELPEKAFAWIVNLVTDDGLVFSSPYVEDPLSETVMMANDALRAEIVPAWGGRLMFFGRSGGKNALWTDLSAATNTVDAKGKPLWKNVGGEKTWVGSMDRWPAFKGGERGWPPPAWFDSAPLDVVRANATNVLLRSSEHVSDDWKVSLEREFTLVGEKMVLRESLRCPDGDAAVSNDSRRVWSVTQIPHVDRISARMVGDGRALYFSDCLKLSAPKGGWSELDLSNTKKNARVALDGDALAAEIPEVGRLVIEQQADARHLGEFRDPSRAIVFSTGKEFKPSVWSGFRANPYIELEFVALGPDAEQTLTFRLE